MIAITRGQSWKRFILKAEAERGQTFFRDIKLGETKNEAFRDRADHELEVHLDNVKRRHHAGRTIGRNWL